jgi:hypothetical protein
VTSTTGARVRRTPAPWWIAALFGIPLIFGFVGSQASKGAIQDDLTERAQQVLQGVGAGDATVTFDGRDATLRTPAGADAAPARDAIAKMPGVRTVVVQGSAQ